MTVKSGQQWSGVFVTRDATGALAAPSAGPTGTLYVDGVANGAAVTISGANPYKWTVTLPALTAGQCVSMYLTATIGGIATAAVVAEDVADTSVNSDTYARIGAAGAGLTALGDARLANLDAAVSTRAVAGDAMALTAAAVDAVWDELTAGHAIAGSAGKALSDASDPWAAAVRTLTSSAAATAATVAGSTVTVTRGDTWSVSITGLGNIAARSKLWWTIKKDQADADAAAIVQVEEAGGLLYLNGAATTTTNATLVVDDALAGNVTLTVKPAATATIGKANLLYDIQMLTGAGAVQTLTSGSFVVDKDITRAVA